MYIHMLRGVCWRADGNGFTWGSNSFNTGRTLNG